MTSKSCEDLRLFSRICACQVSDVNDNCNSRKGTLVFENLLQETLIEKPVLLRKHFLTIELTG